MLYLFKSHVTRDCICELLDTERCLLTRYASSVFHQEWRNNTDRYVTSYRRTEQTSPPHVYASSSSVAVRSLYVREY